MALATAITPNNTVENKTINIPHFEGFLTLSIFFSASLAGSISSLGLGDSKSSILKINLPPTQIRVENLSLY